METKLDRRMRIIKEQEEVARLKKEAARKAAEKEREEKQKERSIIQSWPFP